MDDLAALSDKVMTQWGTAGDRLDKAEKAIQEFPDGVGHPEFHRLLREEAKATGAWHAWQEMHQLVVDQRMARLDRTEKKGGES